jgi:hypothetical protein
VEIMSDVAPENIFVIDRARKNSAFATSIPAVQAIVDHIGSVQNVHLARLWSAKKCILVEGKDMGYLTVLHRKLFPSAEEVLSTIPNMSIGGWGGWTFALGTSLLAKNAFGEDVIIYCVLDRDYHTDEEITKRYDEARSKGVELHIWSRKEIESYLVFPDAILRIIDSRRARRTEPPTLEVVEHALDEVLDSPKDGIFDSIATAIQAQDRSLTTSSVNKKARTKVEEAWRTRAERIAIAPGKTVISRMSEWSQHEFGVSFGPWTIAQEMVALEFDQEVISFLSALERGERLHAVPPTMTATVL